jgi:ferredoxin-NADP reductase
MKRILVVNSPEGEWDGETGRLNGQRIIDLTKPSPKDFIYVSGPEPMVEALGNELEALSIKKERVVSDFFPGYSSI